MDLLEELRDLRIAHEKLQKQNSVLLEEKELLQLEVVARGNRIAELEKIK